MVFNTMKTESPPPAPQTQDIKKTSTLNNDNKKEKSPEKWNRPSRDPPEATRKPKRDVKDFATDFDLTESTMNQAFAMSPKLKSRGMKSTNKSNKSEGTSGFKSYDSGYVLEELSPDAPSERHLVSPKNNKKDE